MFKEKMNFYESYKNDIVTLIKKSDVVDPNEKILAPIVCIAFIFPKSDITKSRRLHNIDPIMLLYVDLNKIDSLNNPINNGYWSYGNNVVALKVHNKTYGFIITNEMVSQKFKNFKMKTISKKNNPHIIKNNRVENGFGFGFEIFNCEEQEGIFIQPGAPNNEWNLMYERSKKKFYFMNSFTSSFQLTDWDDIVNFVKLETICKSIKSKISFLNSTDKVDVIASLVANNRDVNEEIELLNDFVNQAPDFIKLYIEST